MNKIYELSNFRFKSTKDEFTMLVEELNRCEFQSSKRSIGIKHVDSNEGNTIRYYNNFDLKAEGLESSKEGISLDYNESEKILDVVICEDTTRASNMRWAEIIDTTLSTIHVRMFARTQYISILPAEKEVLYRVKLLNQSYLVFKTPLLNDNGQPVEPAQFKTTVFLESEQTKHEKYRELNEIIAWHVVGFTKGNDGGDYAIIEDLAAEGLVESMDNRMEIWNLIMSHKVTPIFKLGSDMNSCVNASRHLIEDIVVVNEKNPKFTKSPLVLI